ncbi:ABC transporter ATP-binding protein [Bacillus salipaludis]|uniref:ABC transporter ATP-binding protein n=1 Tax=Bacillus salipaludis TaxID=2547811 RepID=A0A4R5VL25_9BACI|nr:ABC transporter ATP-binding protein [Bacillus salipaludis]MDQ6599073.1 ABC transporter ATP-binding protein [Bacillus salipaludis]TDK58727.1 ABC transporter ATP-binding protein [Bacillus salipaludis]
MSTVLEIQNVSVSYGKVPALKNISLQVNQGEIVALLGVNGAGKSTTLRTISGLIRPKCGSIHYNGEPIHKRNAHEIVKKGLIHVPEGRRVFSTMTVEENLQLGSYCARDHLHDGLKEVYELFPRLFDRRKQLSGTLSGGEQQMLAMGRAMMGKPKLLLLDEPSMGLAPIIVRTIFDTIKKINETGTTILLVEQNARAALRLTKRAYVMELGEIVREDETENLIQDKVIEKIYLGG